MSLGDWSFAGATLNVLAEPVPVWQDGYQKIIHKHAGVDGASAIDDSRLPCIWAIAVALSSHAALIALMASVNGGTTGDFIVPTPDGDTMVYADAFLQNPRWVWPPSADFAYWQLTIDVFCPDPIPTKGSDSSHWF